MTEFIHNVKARNETLFYFGCVCLAFALVCLVLAKFTNTQVYNTNAWFKPFKFAFSTFLFAWAMAWYCFELPSFNVAPFNWAVIVLLGFEIVYIAVQAGRGELSHYNQSTPLYSALYSMMALAATLVTLYTAYVGILFFITGFPTLPGYYVWSIRLGILVFVVFSFEGFVMGSRMSHTIGGPDGGEGLPLLNWSTKYGDPRIPHFIGMHALQALPLVSFYVLKNTKATFVFSFFYALLAVFTLVQALQGKPFIPLNKQIQNDTINT